MLLGAGYLLVLAILAFEVPLVISLNRRVHAEVQSQARSQADVLAATASDLLASKERPTLQALVRRVAKLVRGRVVVVDANARVLADSAGAEPPNQPFDRPEIAQALAGRAAQLTRNSKTLNAHILATTAPLLQRGRITGAVRVTQSVAATDRAVRRVVLNLAGIGVAVLLIGLVVGTIIARAITGPMKHLRESAEQIAVGDLEVRARVEGSSEQQSLARSFNDMTDRLSLALEAQKQFVADASHQLRTPLAGLRLRIEEAQAAGVSEAAEAEIRQGTLEIDRLARTIDELLILSSAGEREMQPDTVDTVEAAEAAHARWSRYAQARSITLTLDAESPGDQVACSRADLDLAIDALLENALHYSPANTTVTVSCRGGSIQVRDEGAGLQPGEEVHVFQRFRRGSASAAGPKGSGLGLPIARALARRWGGEVTLMRQPEGGAMATIELPLCRAFTNARLA
ncbi:MAG TPA: HAMP domain-containing sensor histidine kinase [Gaiellales bacterium]|nr:HAMP domain-containing sensor histidine kinase [Gaiellales bacterium]